MRWWPQPYVLEAATLCAGGCNPICWRPQPYLLEAATLSAGGRNPTCVWWAGPVAPALFLAEAEAEALPTGG